MSSLLGVDESHLGGALLFSVFSSICYFHQIAMISVIKLRRVAGLADLHGVNFWRLFPVLKLWFECCDFGSIVLLFGWFNFLSMDGWCFFWYRFILSLLCFPVYRDTFFILRAI